MRVTLAYPYEGHQPDQTVDLDDQTAQMLLRSGRARPADTSKARATAEKKEA